MTTEICFVDGGECSIYSQFYPQKAIHQKDLIGILVTPKMRRSLPSTGNAEIIQISSFRPETTWCIWKGSLNVISNREGLEGAQIAPVN